MSVIKEHIEFDPKDLIKVSDFMPLMGRTETITKQLFKGGMVYLKEKGDNNMSMEIKADRIKKYKITKIKMLHKEAIGKSIVLRYIDHKTKLATNVLVNIDDEITELEFRFVANMICLAGKRLHRINHKNDKKKTDKKEKEFVEWTGSYTFEA